MFSEDFKGAVVWARQTIESDIFRKKPAVWFKVWFFIVLSVNFKDNKIFKKGSDLFTYRQISDHTGANFNQIDSFVRWGKEQSMLTTQKTTRGFIINVLNYAKYQDFKTYKTDTETETKPKHNRNITDTIIKNDKNDKNIHSEWVNKFKGLYENETKSPFKASSTEYMIAAKLIKDYGIEMVEKKMGILLDLCKNKKAWFTKDSGMASFSIGKLSQKWNEIILPTQSGSLRGELL